ncbi:MULTISPECIES: helicase associated domain-containing protein [unclassified Streptomyces]|uniref:helicase associated domain-containing protein n=1 Tax=Streptomyces sp. NPDC055082 TaxID=3365718 RepID=UPI0037D03E2F
MSHGDPGRSSAWGFLLPEPMNGAVLLVLAVVPRSWSEELPDGTQARLGVWLSNTKSRRDRLTQEQRAALAELGVEWA